MNNVNFTGMDRVATWVGSHMKAGTCHVNIMKVGDKVAMNNVLGLSGDDNLSMSTPRLERKLQ